MTLNKIKGFGVSAAVVVVLGGGVAAARSTGGAPAAPGIPAEVSNMGCLVGEWKGTGQLVMGDQKAELKITLSCRWQSGGYGVACQSKFVGPAPIGTMEETDLFGYEPGTRKYHWFSVTNGGETHDHVADVPTGNTIDWVFNGKQGDQPVKETIRFAFSQDSKQLEFKSETTVAGATQAVFTGKVKK